MAFIKVKGTTSGLTVVDDKYIESVTLMRPKPTGQSSVLIKMVSGMEYYSVHANQAEAEAYFKKRTGHGIQQGDTALADPDATER